LGKHFSVVHNSQLFCSSTSSHLALLTAASSLLPYKTEPSSSRL